MLGLTNLQIASIDWADFFARWGAGILIFLCTTVVSFVLGRLLGRYRARRDYAQKSLLGRININVNCFANNFLKIRTLLERSLEEVFLNPVAVEKVLAAAKQTKVDQPLLPLPPEDCWFLLNFVLNAVVERFGFGVIRQDAGEPVKTLRYVLFLTCEQVGDDRIRKVRALMLQEELLRNFPYHESLPQLEDAHHADRIDTLRTAAKMYATHPHYFLSLEIYL